MQISTYEICFISTSRLQTPKKLEEKLLLERFSRGDMSAFWELWQQHRDYLYYRCLSWMGDNFHDAEDALSLASLKALDKLPKYVEKITNLRAWFTRLTHNICIDIHRKRYRKRITSTEEIAWGDDEAIITNIESPESVILRDELKLYIHQTLRALSDKLRSVFILHYFYQYSYQDIAQLLKLSLDNVYKCIQQARNFLKKHLSKYLSGLDDSKLDDRDDSYQALNYLMDKSTFFDEIITSGSKKK
ncbi:MAG: RNA polymerase sigma factor [Rivularia sp. ALOHA_DT_140]|nr:RNA polymerase sigma factor [Rivularia sp. ALOHA_DT_140]